MSLSENRPPSPGAVRLHIHELKSQLDHYFMDQALAGTEALFTDAGYMMLEPEAQEKMAYLNKRILLGQRHNATPVAPTASAPLPLAAAKPHLGRALYHDVSILEKQWVGRGTDLGLEGILRTLSVHGLSVSGASALKTIMAQFQPNTHYSLREDVTDDDVRNEDVVKKTKIVHSVQFCDNFHKLMKGTHEYTGEMLTITGLANGIQRECSFVRGVPVDKDSAEVASAMASTGDKHYIFPYTPNAWMWLGAFVAVIDNESSSKPKSAPSSKFVLRQQARSLPIAAQMVHEANNVLNTMPDDPNTLTLINKIQQMLLDHSEWHEALEEFVGHGARVLDMELQNLGPEDIPTPGRFELAINLIKKLQCERNTHIGKHIRHRLMNPMCRTTYMAHDLMVAREFWGRFSGSEVHMVGSVTHREAFDLMKPERATLIEIKPEKENYKGIKHLLLTTDGKYSDPTFSNHQLLRLLTEGSSIDVGCRLSIWSNALNYDKKLHDNALNIALRDYKIVPNTIVNSGGLHTPDSILTFERLSGKDSTEEQLKQTRSTLEKIIGAFLAVALSANKYFMAILRSGDLNHYPRAENMGYALVANGKRNATSVGTRNPFVQWNSSAFTVANTKGLTSIENEEALDYGDMDQF